MAKTRKEKQKESGMEKPKGKSKYALKLIKRRKRNTRLGLPRDYPTPVTDIIEKEE